MIGFINVKNLYKSFEKQNVLQNVNLQVKKGEIVGLLGPNGAGKTTLIRILNGVIKADQGEISVNGRDPVTDGDEIRRISGIVTESAGLYHQLSGEENLRFFGDLYGVTDQRRIEELLNLFELTEHKNKMVGKYSTGMRKRLALAKALIHNPEILFLDEPTNGLDPDGIQQVLAYLKKYNEETGTTIIICSHVLHQLETVCHSFAIIDNRTIVEQGSLQALEDKYIKEISVKVNTTFHPSEHEFGYPFRLTGENMVTFDLPSKCEIPTLLKEILKTDPIYSVTQENTDLQSIYFKVRGQNHEQIL